MYQKKSNAIKIKMIKPYKKTNYVRIIILLKILQYKQHWQTRAHICMSIRQ